MTFSKQVYSVRVRVDSDLVLRLLLGKGQFDVARKYASIVGSTASEVTIKEVCLFVCLFVCLYRGGCRVSQKEGLSCWCAKRAGEILG